MGSFFGQRTGGLTNPSYLGAQRRDQPTDIGKPTAETGGATTMAAGGGGCDAAFRSCQKACEETRRGGGPGVERCLERCQRQYDRCKEKPGPTPTPTECPEGSGNKYEGCPCGHGYATKTGS